MVGEMDDSDWSRIRAWILMKGFTDRHPLVLVAAGSDAANMCAVMGSRCCESGSQRERGLVKLGWGVIECAVAVCRQPAMESMSVSDSRSMAKV